MGRENKKKIITLIASRSSTSFPKGVIDSFTTYRDIADYLDRPETYIQKKGISIANAETDSQPTTYDDPEWEAFMELWTEPDWEEMLKNEEELEAFSRKLSARSRGKYEGYYRFYDALLWYEHYQLNDSSNVKPLSRAKIRIEQALQANDDYQFELLYKIIDISSIILHEDDINYTVAYDKLKSMPNEYDRKSLVNTQHSLEILKEEWFENTYNNEYNITAIIIGHSLEINSNGNLEWLELALKYYQLVASPSTLKRCGKDGTVQDAIDELKQMIASASNNSSSSNAQSIATANPTETDNNEKEYLDTLKELLEDGEISGREHRMLNRMRESLGISEARAAELEASLKAPKLSEDEQEYLDMFSEYVANGEITEKIRRRLDRFASALGISQVRIKEIENLK